MLRRLNRAMFWRWFYGHTRPPSYPYVSGDGFRRMAKYVYDERSRFEPNRVREGDVIFVATHLVPEFFGEVDPRIDAGYILITHNSDAAADELLIGIASEKTRMWYAQNNTFSQKNIVPIPIGLENLHLYNTGIIRHYRRLAHFEGLRQDRILCNFNIATNAKERQSAFDAAAGARCADLSQEHVRSKDYLQRLRTYKFVLSPPGNGLDTHRTWEAMYLGVVPIVKDSVAMRSFEQLGLPLWIVKSWDELEMVTEESLRARYTELRERFQVPALFAEYWRQRILGDGPRRID
jgi:hypothetical protein